MTVTWMSNGEAALSSTIRSLFGDRAMDLNRVSPRILAYLNPANAVSQHEREWAFSAALNELSRLG